MSASHSGSPRIAPSRARSSSRPDPDSQRAGGSPVRPGCESISLDAGGDSAVLLLHGFGDTPQTLTYVAPALHSAGYTVRAPLLPGHGRDVQDFARSTGDEWLAAARDSLNALRRDYGQVGICGLSMGGALSILLAAEYSDIPALVLIAPYVAMPPVMAAAALSHRLWGNAVGVMGSGTTRSIWDPEERERNLGYGRATGKLLFELWSVARRARRALPAVTAPTLVIQSRQDNRIRPRVARHVYRSIGSTRKRIVFTEGAGHIITVDYGRERVVSEVRDWFAAHLGSSARSAK